MICKYDNNDMICKLIFHQNFFVNKMFYKRLSDNSKRGNKFIISHLYVLCQTFKHVDNCPINILFISLAEHELKDFCF